MSATPGPRLMLVRHGQTDSNIHRALDTVPPGPPLNAAGLDQAQRAGERIAAVPVIAVYASEAIRAQQTAAPLAARHALPVTVVPRLQEVFCGDFEGRADHAARKLFDETYSGWVAGDLDRRLPGGESAIDVRNRFVPTVTELWGRHADQPEGTVVVVSHGGAMQISARAMIGDFETPRYVPNTGWVILAPMPDSPTGWRLEQWDTAQDAGVPDPRGDVTGGAHEPDTAQDDDPTPEGPDPGRA